MKKTRLTSTDAYFEDFSEMFEEDYLNHEQFLKILKEGVPAPKMTRLSSIESGHSVDNSPRNLAQNTADDVAEILSFYEIDDTLPPKPQPLPPLDTPDTLPPTPQPIVPPLREYETPDTLPQYPAQNSPFVIKPKK